MKKRKANRFDLKEYLKKFEYLMPDYNPEYISKDEKESYCKEEIIEI